MALIPQWREWWKLYSTYWFIILGMVGALGDYVNTAIDIGLSQFEYMDFPGWVSFAIKLAFYLLISGIGIYSRLKLQGRTL